MHPRILSQRRRLTNRSRRRECPALAAGQPRKLQSGQSSPSVEMAALTCRREIWMSGRADRAGEPAAEGLYAQKSRRPVASVPWKKPLSAEFAVTSKLHPQVKSAMGGVDDGWWPIDDFSNQKHPKASNLRRDSNCSCFPPSDVDASAGPRHHSANQRPRDYNSYPAPLPSRP